ncbi:hypothetical protein BOO69_08110 [Sulfitobacter alexandrii]|uniref:Methyltransferase FkbM domain-containing protein n=1 Tax=Sulfitobacter alexandrii TaxID=1917485 RepID=A0A1J0WGX6_9RHOB|nr:FkbM family methyltransferase [Sulfitobacter alexandrii]APE43382.1 hypothetical protein BOO69_08110 [Sulfitobacter alexandrii]
MQNVETPQEGHADLPDIPRSALRTLQGRIDYLRALLDLERPLRIVDVGANPVNVPDYAELLAIGACEVWGFEPEPEAFAALKAQAGANTHVIQRAIGKTGKGKFYPHRSTGLGSTLKMDAASVSYLGRPGWHANQGEGTEIDLIALDDMPTGELPRPDLLKIDIQGGELDVLESAQETLSEAIAVITEVRFAQMYADEPMWAEIDLELRHQGFVLHKMAAVKSIPVGNSMRAQMVSAHFRSQMLDGDAVYIRDPREMDDWTGDQVRQLAIAAAGVFNSYDLVIACLDHLVTRGEIAAQAPADFFNKLPKWMTKAA